MERQIATREITAKIEKTFFSFSRPWLWACFLNGPNAAALVAPTLIRHWLTGTARIVCAAGVYATVGSPSVCLSVRLSHCSSGGEAVTQCGQCHVHTVGTRLTTDRPSVMLRNMYTVQNLDVRMVAILQYGHRFDTARPYTTVTRSLLSMSHIWHALKQVIAPGAARRYAPPPRRWQFDSRRIYVRPRTGPQSAHG